MRLSPLLVALVLLGACGTSDPGGAASSTTTTTAAATDDTTTSTTTVEVNPGVSPRGETVDSSLIAPDGTERTYHVYVPDSLPNDGSVPVVLALHGGTGWGLQFQLTSGFDALAEANGFLVVYPDGTRINLTPEGRVWNAGNCCGVAQQDRDDVDDVGFLSALIDRLEGDYAIDPSRVFAAGHSNGAMMSYRLACELSDKVVAVGFQAGALEIDDCAPSQPVSVLHIHGSADLNVPIEGGLGNGIAGVVFNSPIESIETLAALNGCVAAPTDSVDPDNADVTTRAWGSCDDDTGVEFVTVEGASHAWMGQPGRPAQEANSGKAYQDFDSALAIWTFLAAHPRR